MHKSSSSIILDPIVLTPVESKRVHDGLHPVGAGLVLCVHRDLVPGAGRQARDHVTRRAQVVAHLETFTINSDWAIV